MTLVVREASPAIGAIVEGVDLGGPLSAETRAALKDAFDRHIVLLFRDQTLDEGTLEGAATWLGALTKRTRPDERRRETSLYISKVSNIRENGELIGSLPDGEMHFHFDGAFLQKPHSATFLYSVETPRVGGDTCFANMYSAYDNLPAALKYKLNGLTALQVYDYSTVEKPRSDPESLKSLRHFSHPVVLTHPITGRKSLYVSRLMTAKINDLEEAESDDLLEELYSYAEDPAIIYQHKWRPGDFVTWDNLCSTHARTDFSSAERRLLLRGIIEPKFQPVA